MTTHEPDPRAQTARAPRAGGGLFLSFEGGDGAGKTTQIRLLAQCLRERGHEVVLTREPGGSPTAERIRELVLDPAHGPIGARTEALLFAAARSSHVEQTILPALQAGQIVISDRYVHSSIAYQGAGRGLGAQAVAEINDWATQSLLPDLTILLDLEAGQGAARRSHRAPDRMEQEAAPFHERVRGSFLAQAAADPQRCAVIDASAAVQEVAHEVLRACEPLLTRSAQAVGHEETR